MPQTLTNALIIQIPAAKEMSKCQNSGSWHGYTDHQSRGTLSGTYPSQSAQELSSHRRPSGAVLNGTVTAPCQCRVSRTVCAVWCLYGTAASRPTADTKDHKHKHSTCSKNSFSVAVLLRPTGPLYFYRLPRSGIMGV